jgi:integrase/recombinase XerC
MTLGEAFDCYRRDIIIFRNLSAKTEEQYIYTFKSFNKFMGDIEVSTLTFAMVREWKIWLDKRGLASSTVRGYLINLRVVLAYLEKQGIETLKPEAIATPKRENKPIDFLTKEEVAELIRYAGIPRRGYPKNNRLRNQTIISILYGSGIRISEMCRLDRGDIYQRTFTAYGKGSKSRVAFIDKRTETLLNAYLSTRKDSNAALFLANQSQKRITSGNVQRLIREIGLRAGFTKPVHPHIFRHSYATDLFFNNTDARAVQALLGHSSLETTQIYMHVTDPHLRAIYEAKHTV